MLNTLCKLILLRKCKTFSISNGIKLNTGMTYVELIVVLSIFAVMSTIVLFNYADFQDKVDIKNLASDIALKIVQAQKSSFGGVLPPLNINLSPGWIPSYGVYFDVTTPKQFTYFTDLSSTNTTSNGYDRSGTETLDTISITKNNFISSIDICNADPCVIIPNSPNNPNTPNNPNSPNNPNNQNNPNNFTSSASPLSVNFKRLSSGAVFYLNSQVIDPTTFNYVQITIESQRGSQAFIKIYPSGRIQVN